MVTEHTVHVLIHGLLTFIKSSVRTGDRIRSQDVCWRIMQMCWFPSRRDGATFQLQACASRKEHLSVQVDGGDFVRVQTVLNQGMMVW